MKREHSPIVVDLLFSVLCVLATRALGGFNLIAVAVSAAVLAGSATEIYLQLNPSPWEDGEELDEEVA